jgi:hypothetical protein
VRCTAGWLFFVGGSGGMGGFVFLIQERAVEVFMVAL